jgi:hypothetical protein
VHNGLAVQFSKPYEWLHLQALSGMVAPSEADTLECQLTTEIDLDPNTYSADISIWHNDPTVDEWMIDAQLQVLGEPQYICGDANSDEIVDVSDAVHIINYIFVGGFTPEPIEAADPNCYTIVDVSDAVWIINYVFVGGNAPCDTDDDGIPDC